MESQGLPQVLSPSFKRTLKAQANGQMIVLTACPNLQLVIKIDQWRGIRTGNILDKIKQQQTSKELQNLEQALWFRQQAQ